MIEIPKDQKRREVDPENPVWIDPILQKTPPAPCPKCFKLSAPWRMLRSGRVQFACHECRYPFILKKPTRGIPHVKGEKEIVACIFCGGKTHRRGAAIRMRRVCTVCGKSSTVGSSKERKLKLALDCLVKLKSGFNKEDLGILIEIALEALDKLKFGFDENRVDDIITDIRMLEVDGEKEEIREE